MLSGCMGMQLLLLLMTISAYLHLSEGRKYVEKVTVHTTVGAVEGYRKMTRAKAVGREIYYSFSGIPYAKPPVGQLRFQPPEPVEPWSGVRDGKEPGPYCLQLNLYKLKPLPVGDEDCLYLSVYSRFFGKGDKVPVMVHFHGGGYISGDGPRKQKPTYLMDEDVVVVDVNYRLGVLGFLSFEDKVMPGNQGLKDQVMALRWVKNNIASFGGDPNSVTIFGESAGGGSVYHHTVSPLSRGLFHRAISESSTSYNVGSLVPRGFVKSYSEKIADFTNCRKSETSQTVACLRGINGSELVSQLEKFRIWQVDPLLNFRPNLEPPGPGAFLVGPIENWKHAPVPLLMGTTSAEGLVRTMYFIYYNMDWTYYNDNFNKLAPLSLQYWASASKPDEITKKVRQFYLPKEKITAADWVNVTQMYTDGLYKIGIMTGADKHTDKVYFYYFDYVGEYSLGGKLNRSLLYGAFHTDEIVYLWDLEHLDDLKGKDLELSNKMVKLWTNFAKHGTPTDGSDLNWETWNPENHRYLHISKDGLKMDKGFAADRYYFWNSLNYRDKFQ